MRLFKANTNAVQSNEVPSVGLDCLSAKAIVFSRLTLARDISGVQVVPHNPQRFGYSRYMRFVLAKELTMLTRLLSIFRKTQVINQELGEVTHFEKEPLKTLGSGESVYTSGRPMVPGRMEKLMDGITNEVLENLRDGTKTR